MEQVLQLADHVPCFLSRDFLDCQTGMIPFTFPPAIDDWDQRMQSSMMQFGSPFGDEAEAASYFCQKLEDAALDISQLEEEVKDLPVEDEDDIMTKAKRLARDALLCLQRHHVAVRWVSEILKDTIDLAVYQVRIKQEQEQVSKRWEVQPKPTKRNRHAAKRERNKPRPELAHRCQSSTCSITFTAAPQYSQRFHQQGVQVSALQEGLPCAPIYWPFGSCGLRVHRGQQVQRW